MIRFHDWLEAMNFGGPDLNAIISRIANTTFYTYGEITPNAVREIIASGKVAVPPGIPLNRLVAMVIRTHRDQGAINISDDE